jgi:tetratricopeptide (TPR) repeat protein
LVRAYWWLRDIDNLKASLERLAEAAAAAGLESDERYALTQLTRLAPELSHHVARLNELGGAEENAAAEELPEFESSAVSAELESESESVPQESPYEPEQRFVASGDTEFEWNSVADMAELKSEAPADDMSLERGFSFEAVVAEELSVSSDDVMAAPNDDDPDRHAAVRAQELESVDFYIAQGYVDIAVDTLDLLERQFGQHEDILRRREQIKRAGQRGSEAPASEAIAADLTASKPASEPAFEFTFGASEPEPFAAVPTSPNGSNGGNGVNGGNGNSAVQVIDPGLAEIFEEYRVSAEAETNRNGDYETHYNLGLAYQEMDLFEEALEEFQTAISMVAPGDGTPRYLQCCNLLGHCFMQKGVPQLAVKWFMKGLGAPNTSDDERQALRFDLAAAYERAGDLDRARDLFTEIYGVNVSYRGVNERLKALEMRMA